MTAAGPLAHPDKDSPNILTCGAWVVRASVQVWEPRLAHDDDDDDDDDEVCPTCFASGSESCRSRTGSRVRRHATLAYVDEVVVQRILGGDTLAANHAERLEVLARWNGSDNHLEHRTGWNIPRLRRETAERAA